MDRLVESVCLLTGNELPYYERALIKPDTIDICVVLRWVSLNISGMESVWARHESSLNRLCFGAIRSTQPTCSSDQ